VGKEREKEEEVIMVTKQAQSVTLASQKQKQITKAPFSLCMLMMAFYNGSS